MNARHPIDELFAQGLRDAEAMPPSGVWQRIAADRDQRAATAWRSRLRAGLLLLLIAGAATTYFLTHGMGNSAPARSTAYRAQPTTTLPASSEVPSAAPVANATELTQPSAPPVQAPTAGTTRPAIANSASPSAGSGGSMRGLRARQPSTTGIHGGTQDNATAGAQQANARTHAGALGATPGEVAQPPHAMEYAQPAPDGAEGPTAENNIDLVLRPYRMDAITRPFDGPPLAVPSARGAGERPYVLPKGASWYGVQVELASTDYHWNGPSGETRALNNSESWGGRKGIGVVYGRDWQSGFGFEVAGTWSKVRSNLFYAEQGPQVVHNTTDTTWTGTPMGQHTIYTWNIVTTSVAEPGPSRTYSAVNTYTMLRFDALASYQRPLGRWTAVLRAGPTLTLFPGHEGNTLVAGTTGSEPASGMMTAVPLSAASVKDRFAPQLGLLAGFDLRYSLSERFMLGMGPTFLTTLGGEEVRNARLNCTEWGGTLRLIYRPAPHERRGR